MSRHWSLGEFAARFRCASTKNGHFVEFRQTNPGRHNYSKRYARYLHPGKIRGQRRSSPLEVNEDPERLYPHFLPYDGLGWPATRSWASFFCSNNWVSFEFFSIQQLGVMSRICIPKSVMSAYGSVARCLHILPGAKIIGAEVEVLDMFCIS